MINKLRLALLPYVKDITKINLLNFFGSPDAIFSESKESLSKVPGLKSSLIEKITNPSLTERAHKEWEKIQQNDIQCFFIQDDDYPQRLKMCEDTPVLFFLKGNVNLNAEKVISIVGTRMATSYGKDLTDKLVEDLATAFPDLLIVSGLAYGIDIHAHRAALRNNLPTISVMAHGLDRIYPGVHKQTANEMLKRRGGILTDFPMNTNPDRQNFVMRNRIVAGISDATIVIESAEKGGSLITADMAFNYGRDVFAFPGRIDDKYSIGCNHLIQENKASLIMNAEDMIKALSWDLSKKEKQLPQQTKLLFEDTDSPIINLLANNREMHINQIAIELDLPIQQLSNLLFDLEIKNKIKALPGNIYRLCK